VHLTEIWRYPVKSLVLNCDVLELGGVAVGDPEEAVG
jgi:hypothetical protein